MLVKYAAVDEILEVKTAHERLPMDFEADGANLAKFAKAESAGEIEDGFLYVRARAISSRVNKNNDGWPSEELSRAYSTFVGRPVFVDHNNQDPKRTRGVIVDAKLHVEDDEEKTAALDPYYASAPDNHKPPTWIEILIEVDGETYPKLAKSIQSGDIDAVSMGANIDRSICSVCTNEASVPSQYCDHISSGKGATFEITADNGEKVKKTAYEDCYGVNFFEISFVFDPADPTADAWLHEGEETKIAKTQKQAEEYGSDMVRCDQCESIQHIKDAAENGGECVFCGMIIPEAELNPEYRKSSIPKGAPYPTNDDASTWLNIGDRVVVTHEEAEGANGTVMNMFMKEGEPIYVVEFQNDPDELISPYWRRHDIVKVGSMAKGAPYPTNSDKNAPDHSPPGQKLPKKVNSIYNACVRESKEGDGEPSDALKEKCMKIAWAKYKEMEKDSSVKETYVVDEDWSHLMRRVAEIDDERTLNHTPQADETTAPQKVDTLRDDVRCPNCESDDLGTDPDGILRCPTCGYEQPPEGLDNPDLDRAKDFDDVQKENEQRDDQGNRETPVRAGEGDTGEGPQDFIAPVQPVGATKTDNATEGISDMIWKRKVKTNDVAEARAFHASTKTAGTAQITPGGKQGIHNGTHGAFRQAGITAVVEYPAEAFALTPPPMIPMIKDNIVVLGAPDANPMKDMFLGDMSMKALGLSSKADIPITVTSDHLEEAIEIIQRLAGAEVVGAVKNGPINKEVVLPGGERKGDEPKDAKVVGDQLAPVEADRRVIKREESPDGTRTEHIVEETGELGINDEPKAEKKDEPKESDEPKKEDAEEKDGDDAEKKDNTPDFLKKKEPAMAAADGEKKLLAAFQVAEDAVELGIIANSHKMAFVAQLEQETLEQIETRRATLAMVKSAGLVKRTIAKGAGRALPKIASHGSNGNGNGGLNLDEIPIEAIFWND